ncbi:MAG: hypothetical protein C0501_12590 [Isosphaera sp.]|nr:hypothetical protein [Isosphaera sp.]
MLRKAVLFGGLAIAAATVVIVGCDNNQPPSEKAAEPKAPPVKPDEEHGHKPGSHGGIIVSLGKDSYHAEAVFEKGRKVRLYMLGKEETRIQEVDAQDLAAFVTPEGSTEAVPVTFKPEPQAGDAKGKTSLFVATLPEEMSGKKVQVTVNNIQVGIERFRIAFSNEKAAHDGDGMPSKVADEDEKKLYLTPGGMYTDADIKANGGVVASVKFKGLKAEHDLKPKTGVKICPVTLTKASPKFSWVIGGKTYEFCCPPCVDEFVALAKENPDKVLDPSAYIKK